MMRTTIKWIAVLGFGLASAFGALAQTRNAAEDRWQATERSMSDFLQEGYQLVSVIAPSPQLRIFFLSKPGSVAKCSEEAKMAPPPPAPATGSKGKPDFDPRAYVPGTETKFECSRLTKSR